MKILGLDIGTTTISAVVLEDGRELASRTRPNGAFLPDREPWEKLQDPAAIRTAALDTVEELFRRYPDIARIGVTGQMHGILYLDRSGAPVSPLYTWQDGRGDRLRDGNETYAACLSRLTGYPLATGYGLVTHFYNLENGLVPEDAAVFCTIHDYLAMVLCGASRPVTDVSDAASFGVFDVKRGRFDLDALRTAGMDPGLLPEIAEAPCIGHYRDNVRVCAAIGDNQASFLGAADGNLERMLVNIGTGSQFSVYTPAYLGCPGLETRPFPGGGYLVVGASLCGGRAFALLEEFFRRTAGMLGVDTPSCYAAMDALLAESPRPQDLPRITPLFQGTRQEPGLRGSIEGLSTENFTPLHLIWAMMEGMTWELYQMAALYEAAGGAPAPLIGSGNGLRKNPFLQDCIRETFGRELRLSSCNEEAATGAARFAAREEISSFDCFSQNGVV